MIRINVNDENLTLDPKPTNWGAGVSLYNGVLFTGIIEEYFEGTTQLLAESELREGILHGRQVEYFPNGQIESEFFERYDGFPTNIKNRIVEPIREELYLEVFNKASIDITNKRARLYDTEVKYIYNFLLNHIGKGNKFIIEIESVLYTCPNCQKYFIALKKYAQTQNIDLQVISRAHPEAGTNREVLELINQ